MKANAQSTWRGFQKFFRNAVGVVEATAWIGLVGLGIATAWCTLKNESVTLNDFGLYYIGLSATVISFRLVYEGAKYFRDLGQEYER